MPRHPIRAGERQQEIGWIEDDGSVYDHDAKVGNVEDNGNVWKKFRAAGKVTPRGRILDAGGHHLGDVRGAVVYDTAGIPVAESEAVVSMAALGGASLMLLDWGNLVAIEPSQSEADAAVQLPDTPATSEGQTEPTAYVRNLVVLSRTLGTLYVVCAVGGMVIWLQQGASILMSLISAAALATFGVSHWIVGRLLRRGQGRLAMTVLLSLIAGAFPLGTAAFLFGLWVMYHHDESSRFFKVPKRR